MSTTYDTRTRLLLAAMLLWPGCSLIGVEPDEIDFANDTEGGNTGLTAATNGGDGDGDTTGDPTGDGDGDGDGSPGDGDGDPGDGDPGDGDPGDGDPGDGDGDDEIDCESLEPEPLAVGDNAVMVPDQPSAFESSCGSPGPDVLLQFTAPSDGDYDFTLWSDSFEGTLVLVGPTCEPLEELGCAPEGQTIQLPMVADETVYVIVDSDLEPGAATVTITGP